MADPVGRMAGSESGDKESCDGSYNPEYKADTPSRDYSRRSHSCNSLNFLYRSKRTKTYQALEHFLDEVRLERADQLADYFAPDLCRVVPAVVLYTFHFFAR